MYLIKSQPLCFDKLPYRDSSFILNFLIAIHELNEITALQVFNFNTLQSIIIKNMLTFHMCKSTEWTPWTVSSLPHVVAFR